METGRTPYRVPRQRRSQESLERLIDAAEELIAADGLENVTVAGVVNKAGLSVGAFYARFPDKKALLYAVQDHFHNRLEPCIHAEMVERASTAPDLAEALACAIDTLVEHVLGERELSRAFMTSSVFDPVLRARGERVNRERRQVFTSVLLAHRDEIGHDNPELAIDVAYGMYAAVVRGALVFGPQHELYYDIADQTIIRELKQALTLYLLGQPGRDRVNRRPASPAC